MRKALRLAGDTHTIEDVIEAIRRGEMQIFHNEKAVIVTEIVDTPQKRFVNGFMSAGELNAVLELLMEVQEWGHKKMGAEFGRAMVRPGYERYLKAKGWKTTMIAMEYYPDDGSS